MSKVKHMAFGIGINTDTNREHKMRGNMKEIACECWFTSTGRTKPILIKYMDEEGQIQTVKNIKLQYVEKKNYAGIISMEYKCKVAMEDIEREVVLIYFIEEGKWCMAEVIRK